VLVTEGRAHFARPTEAYTSVIREGLAAFWLSRHQFDAAKKGHVPPLMIDTVFVYGTLMQGQGNHGLLAQGASVESITRATVKAGMVDLGGYPAAFRTENGQIQGELIRVRRLEEVLRRLDRLEGFTGYHLDSLYHRVLALVDVEGGLSCDAWIYLLAGSRKNYPIIASGDWRGLGRAVSGMDNRNRSR